MRMLEESRDLTIVGWNFKNLFVEKLTNLLKQQIIYYKQRGTIKWVKFGDQGTNSSMQMPT
jgi:hypothetical protein